MEQINIDELVNVQPICNELGIEYGLYSSYMKRMYRKRLKNRKQLLGITDCEEIFIPTFEMASNPTVMLSEIKARRFNIVNRNPITLVPAPAPVLPSKHHNVWSYSSMKSRYVQRVVKQRTKSLMDQMPQGALDRYTEIYCEQMRRFL